MHDKRYKARLANRILGVKLTTRILEAILDMSNWVDAGGPDECQGIEPETARLDKFDACVDAGNWAAQELRKRAERKKAVRS